MKPRLVVLALTGALIGCTSLDDVRNSAPIRTELVAGDYQAISVCITREQQAKLAGVQLLDDSASQAATITGRMEDGWTRPPLYELTLAQQGGGQVLAELRSPKTIWGTPLVDAENAWDTLKACANNA